MERIWIALGSVAGLSGVGMAAAAGHGLPERLDPASLQMVRNAVQIHLSHSVVLVVCGVWTLSDAPRLVSWAAAVFALGLMLFCGAVYALALAGLRLPAVAPTGGMQLMIGWLLLGIAALRAG
ncbi:MAG: DUF423 domain-containing protein [Acetobacteraceae bacterium]|nr:DUF423 domain-containing protein [Acetobacteraceae bacterium]